MMVIPFPGVKYLNQKSYSLISHDLYIYLSMREVAAFAPILAGPAHIPKLYHPTRVTLYSHISQSRLVFLSLQMALLHW